MMTGLPLSYIRPVIPDNDGTKPVSITHDPVKITHAR